MNTTLTSEKIQDYAVMLCDALYMNLKEYQIRSHKRSIEKSKEEYELNYHLNKIEELKVKGPDVEYYLRTGKKYFKLIMKDAGGQQSVHAFIDRENGDVYKPASWQGPAKIARYCLMNDDHREWLYANADWAGGYLYIR